MSALLCAALVHAATFGAALGLGLGLLRVLRCDARVRDAAGGLLGALWLGLCAVDGLLELVLCAAPGLWRPAALALHAAGLALALAHACSSARRARGDAVLASRARRVALSAALLLALLALVPALTDGLAGVDALEVYRLKARALDEGTLEQLAPRALGASHPLFVPTIVAWHAALGGEVSAAAQIGVSLLAWFVAARLWYGVLRRATNPRLAVFSLAIFAASPPLLALVPRGEADLPLLACVLGAAACWNLGSSSARALALLFALGAAAAKNEGLAWIALGGALYLARGSAGAPIEPLLARVGRGLCAALFILALRLPALLLRARSGTFVEHLDAADLGALLDPAYLVHRGGIVLEELWLAGGGPASAVAAPLWLILLALLASERAARARGPVLLGTLWFASVFVGVLLGGYDARWQTSVAAARIWIQASPWLVLAYALLLDATLARRAVEADDRAAGAHAPASPRARELARATDAHDAAPDKK
ncbi:MAG: hypothetical protein JNM84_01555 [Planctomycetes bacterium]|nr:hypothetical protein [Planctomycetota bacterium]